MLVRLVKNNNGSRSMLFFNNIFSSTDKTEYKIL